MRETKGSSSGCSAGKNQLCCFCEQGKAADVGGNEARFHALTRAYALQFAHVNVG